MDWKKTLRTKIDPEVYVYLSNVYSAAAHRQMPVDKPGAFRAPDEPGPWLVLKDIPLNRGMMAVVGELRSMKIAGEQMHAYMQRIMDFGQIFDDRELFSEFIKEGEEPDSVMVAEALIKAVAVADYKIRGTKAKLDTRSVLKHARLFAEKDEAESRSPPEEGAGLPPPLVPADVDLRATPIPREAFIELAMKQFGVSREEAERYVNAAADAIEKKKPH